MNSYEREIHIEADADCDLYHFKTLLHHLKAGEDYVIDLKPGRHKFECISTQLPEVSTSLVYTLAPSIYCDFIEVGLRDKLLKALENVKLYRFERNGKYGFFDKSGKVVIPCQWKEAWPFSEGLARVEDEDDKWGYIDKTGQVVIPCQWRLSGPFSEGLAVVQNEDGKWGFIDKKGQVIIPCQWEDAGGFSEGLARVADEYRKYGYIDKTGKVVIPCQWWRAEDFSEGFAMVKGEHGKLGFIDKAGKVVSPCQWTFARPFSEGLAEVWDGGWHKIDKTGQVIE